jgi:hypothetical protein
MVRMAQEWSMRYRLVDGQGNLDLLTATAQQQCVIQRLNARFQKKYCRYRKRNC